MYRGGWCNTWWEILNKNWFLEPCDFFMTKHVYWACFTCNLLVISSVLGLSFSCNVWPKASLLGLVSYFWKDLFEVLRVLCWSLNESSWLASGFSWQSWLDSWWSHCCLDIIGKNCDVAEPIFLCKFTIVALGMWAIIVPHNLWNALLTEYLLC